MFDITNNGYTISISFPDEVCSKIFMYACKSPHTGLGVAILKKIIDYLFIIN